MIATLIIVAIVTLVYLWLTQRLDFWRRHRVPFCRPHPIFGSLRKLFFLRTSFGSLFENLHKYAAVLKAPAIGIYILNTPALLIRDPRLIKTVLITKFHIFSNRYEAADSLHDYIGAATLPLSKYPVWRESRKRISSFFTSRKLKGGIYPLMVEIAKDLEQHIAEKIKDSGTDNVVIELKEMCTLFTIDVTSALICSVRSHTIQHGDHSLLRKEIFNLMNPSLVKAIHFFTVFFLPYWTSILRAKVFPHVFIAFMQQMFISQVRIRQKHKKAECNWNCSKKGVPLYRDDLINLLLNFHMEAITTNRFEFAQLINFITSQVAIFTLAGYETSSSAIAFILYELARQPKLQDFLRLELKQHFAASSNGCLSYEQLLHMPYLHMVVLEGLRLYPSAPFINREYTPIVEEDNELLLEAYNLNFKIPDGMPLYISILGTHRDPEFWPKPNNFDPERFSSVRVHKMNPMIYLPFGLGPHNCVGKRVGLMQVKIGLAHILKEYRVEFCAKTLKKIEFEPTSFMLSNRGGMYLNFIKDV